MKRPHVCIRTVEIGKIEYCMGRPNYLGSYEYSGL